jgi:hypothetical protein
LNCGEQGSEKVKEKWASKFFMWEIVNNLW